MIDKELTKNIQEKVGATPDGVIGPKTLNAVLTALGGLSEDELIRAVQKKVGVTVDGKVGPKTLAAIAAKLGVTTSSSSAAGGNPAASKRWPTQAEVRTGKSIFGPAGCEDRLVSITPAYPLYYDGKPLKTIRVHREIAQDVKEILEEVLAAYGLERIHALGLDDYAGSYNNRSTTGGKSKSMHAWGIALDFAAAKNSYYTHKPKASLSIPECEKWWEIWEAHGAVSLGRHSDVDWMHVQFARF